MAETETVVGIDLAHVVPLTGRRGVPRLLLLAVVACLAGGIAGCAIAGHTSGWAALLSLPVPGLGQLVQGNTVMGIVFLVLTLFVLIDLFALFNRLLHLGSLPLVLLSPAAAFHAGTRGEWWAIPAGAAGGLAFAFLWESFNYRAKRRRMARVEAARAANPPESVQIPAYAAVEHAPAPAMDEYAEAYLRYFLQFTHAAPDDWSVFDDPKHVDSALRYQMVIGSWAMYVAQHLATPAYREAAGIGVGNCAERCRDYRVWSYTRRQQFTTYRIDGDPFGHENVMYSGYAADVVSMYEALTGDRRYDQPGGYSVSDRHKTYEWNHRDIVDNLALQHAASPHGAISCVPGWLWPPCQTFSLRAIQLGDLVHDADHHWAAERFGESFGKYFVGDDDHIDTCRHIAGFVHPTDAFIVGVSGQAGTGAMMSPFGRRYVERNYAAHVKARMKPVDDDGRIELELNKLDTFDTSYGWNPAQPYSLAMLYAAEMGDTESRGRLAAHARGHVHAGRRAPRSGFDPVDEPHVPRARQRGRRPGVGPHPRPVARHDAGARVRAVPAGRRHGRPRDGRRRARHARPGPGRQRRGRAALGPAHPRRHLPPHRRGRAG